MPALLPFAPAAHLRAFQLKAEAHWQHGVLELHYRLEHAGSNLILPAAAAAPERRDGLWQHTCFEAFLSQRGLPGYWEINLSPSGHWNVYRLSSYRENLQPEPAVTQLPLLVHHSATGLELRYSLPLASLLNAAEPLELSVTAVLEQTGSGCSYWAWQHSGAEPDFHRRDSFTTLAAERHRTAPNA